MKNGLKALLCAGVMSLSCPSFAQEAAPVATVPAATVSTAAVAPAARFLPASTLVVVAPLQEITSKKAKEGTRYMFSVVNDVVENGVVAIPRGTPVEGEMTWKTGRAIGGKSGKFDIEFRSLTLGGKSYPLRGKHRQEGRGNTVGALLGSMFISGKSAVMEPGQMVNAFTTEQIAY